MKKTFEIARKSWFKGKMGVVDKAPRGEPDSYSDLFKIRIKIRKGETLAPSGWHLLFGAFEDHVRR